MSDQSLAQHRNTRTTPRCSGPNSSGQERLHAQAPPLSVRLRFATRRAQDLASSQHDQQVAPKKPRNHRASDCLHRPRVPRLREPAAARGRRSDQYQDRYEISVKRPTCRRKTTAPNAPTRRLPSFCHATARALEVRPLCAPYAIPPPAPLLCRRNGPPTPTRCSNHTRPGTHVVRKRTQTG